MKKVVIDFGHGLPDPGAVKYGQEYKYARQIGVEVAKRLPESIKVIYTRTSEKALDSNKGRDLNARCNIANKARASLFVSIHLNAGGGTGYETLVYSPCKEGDVIHAEIAKVLSKYAIKDRGIKTRKDVRVLNGTQMPALLLECLFIDNKADMDKLNNQNFFREFCQAIADGIAKAVGIAPKQHKPTSAANKPNKKEEELRLYKPSNQTMRSATRVVLNRLSQKDPGGISPDWVKKLDAGKLTESDATGLLYTAIERGLIVGDKK